MSARDIRYGRQGGRWVDHDPSTWREDLERAKGTAPIVPTTCDSEEQLSLFEAS
jgi:hypothetical protein